MLAKAPIVLFTYCRPEHTRRTVESLLCNEGAEEHDLIIYSDAARIPEHLPRVEAVREYLKTIKGFHSVTIHYRPYNYGLAKSIIEGVTEVLNHNDQIIVLEDDLVTSKYFLKYMSESLNRFADDERVISIHGWMYPVKQPLPEAFFLCGADCLGWATWRRGWALFNPDGRFLLNELKKRKLLAKFDYNGSYLFSRMLVDQIKGKTDSWAIRWYASAFLENKLTLYPSRSLVHHIGNDGSGTNFGKSTELDTELSDRPIDLSNVRVEESIMARKAIENFWWSKTLLIRRIYRKLLYGLHQTLILNY